MSFFQGTGFEKEIGQQRFLLTVLLTDCSQLTTYWRAYKQEKRDAH